MYIDSNEQNVQHLFVTIFQELHSRDEVLCE